MEKLQVKEKLQVEWKPEMAKNIGAILHPDSPYFDGELFSYIYKMYGSLTNFMKIMNPDGTLKPFKLFTSYDGKDIMVGQDCYIFNDDEETWDKISEPFQAMMSIVEHVNGNPEKGIPSQKFFSSREAIEEYALMKSKSISISDLSPWMNEDNEFNGIKIEDLFELVKARLIT